MLVERENGSGLQTSATVIMLNPSYGGSIIIDKSKSIVEELVFDGNSNFGNFKKLFVLNLYPLIKTEKFKAMDCQRIETLENNIARISEKLNLTDTIIIAWGKRGPKKGEIYKFLKKRNPVNNINDYEQRVLTVLMDNIHKQILLFDYHPSFRKTHRERIVNLSEPEAKFSISNHFLENLNR